MIRYFLPLLMAAAASAHAESPVYIDIHTEGAKIDYTLNNQAMAPEQMTKWLKAQIQSGVNDPIIVHANDATTFNTVFVLLSRLKDCGVKRFEIVSSEEIRGANEHLQGMLLTPDNVASWQRPLPPVVIPGK